MTCVRLLAACLLLLAASAYADDIEDRAVDAVQKLGGTVTRDDNDPAHPVVGVNLVGAIRTTDSQLLDVSLLKDVKSLGLSACLGVTDKGVKYVATMKVLESLNLAYTGLTDKSMKTLAALDKLQTLSLAGDKVTDDGLKDLAALKQLRSLNLAHTQVTDDGVAALQKALPDCKISR